jgi:poly-gamma-glutamate synthesis protein (capsule biosynthesis protein)
MKKYNKILAAALLALAGISLSACGTTNDIKADVFGTTMQSQSPVLDTAAGQKPLYDRAYDQAKNYFVPEYPVRGAVIAATLQSSKELAGFFTRLQKGQHYDTIVLLTPADVSAFSGSNGAAGTFGAVVGDYAYKTPYGLIQPPADLLQKIQNDKISPVSETVAKREAWPGMLAPFVVRSFPGTTFLPVFVDENAGDAVNEKLAEWLNTNLPQDSLVLAQTVSKTSADQNVADFQLKFIENVLENFDTAKLQTLPLNSAAAVDVLEKYLGLRQAWKMQNQFMDPQSGDFISFSMDGPLYPGRSAFIVAFGDLMFDRAVRSLMDSHTMDYPFQLMDLSYLKSNDILVANLEGPIAKKRVVTAKTIAFRFDPDIVPLLQKYFFDALSQANNHAYDMGITGYNDSFNFLTAAGIKPFGDPKQLDDHSVATFDVGSQKIAFLGLEEVVYKIDDAAAVAKIRELTAQGYKVIPFLHWGIEYQHRPNDRQQQLAHEFIDAGAVAVIGCHPHVVQTFETYKNRPIFYSLGNGIFDQYFSADTQEGLSVALIISNDQLQIYFLPIKIEQSQFRLMTADERTAFLQKYITWGSYETEAEREDILNGKLVVSL